MRKMFSDIAWEEYQFWVETDRKMLRRINTLIRDIERNGNAGIGKPEPLKYDLDGFWSRRIDARHRLIYSVDGDILYIAKCKMHYR